MIIIASSTIVSLTIANFRDLLNSINNNNNKELIMCRKLINMFDWFKCSNINNRGKWCKMLIIVMDRINNNSYSNNRFSNNKFIIIALILMLVWGRLHRILYRLIINLSSRYNSCNSFRNYSLREIITKIAAARDFNFLWIIF